MSSRTFFQVTACTKWAPRVSPNNTAKAQLAANSGSKLLLNLQASYGTLPYFPGNAVMQEGSAAAEVALGTLVAVVEPDLIVL